MMRQRNAPAAADSGSATHARAGASTDPGTAPPSSNQKRDTSHEHEHEEHDHDHPIDEEKLDNLLWEISKFCLPVGFVLYLSIYLCYRHELYQWFTRSNIALDPSLSTSRPPVLARGATVDAPAPTAAGSAEAGAGGEGDKFETWVKKEERTAWAAMAANIGPEVGAADGVVVAATSTGEWEDEPDYHVS